MRTIYIDCQDARTADEVWDRYVDAACPDGPDFFGRNFDAFWDAIEGAGPGWPGEAKLVFKNTASLNRIRLANGLSFLDCLRQIADEATYTKVELA
jgi:ribonuclease inhibitor